MDKPIRVAVIDDHELYRHGVTKVLTKSGKFSIVAEGASAGEAIRIAETHVPDIMLLDIHMPGDGIAAARSLSTTHPMVKIVMLTESETDTHVSRAMMAGAAGYIVKGVTGPELTKTIGEIHLGERFVSPELAARILLQQGPGVENLLAQRRMAKLTAREREVIGHAVLGSTNKEIARFFSLSETTVKHHLSNIMQKLQVRNRTELARVASDLGLDIGSTLTSSKSDT
jgi:two-component system, NarL family, nitrate/nitrite response regulator NarL